MKLKMKKTKHQKRGIRSTNPRVIFWIFFLDQFLDPAFGGPSSPRPLPIFPIPPFSPPLSHPHPPSSPSPSPPPPSLPPFHPIHHSITPSYITCCMGGLALCHTVHRNLGPDVSPPSKCGLCELMLVRFGGGGGGWGEERGGGLRIQPRSHNFKHTRREPRVTIRYSGSAEWRAQSSDSSNVKLLLGSLDMRRRAQHMR